MKEKNYNNLSVDKKSRRLTKLNNVTSIDSISERNEESSNSTIKNKLQSKAMLKNKVLGQEEPKGNFLGLSIRKPKRQTLEADYNNNKKLKPFRRKESKKKFDMSILKRISFQQNNSFNFYNNIKTRDIFRKRESIKRTDGISTNDNQKSFEFSSKNNVNISRTESFLDNKYFSSKK